MSGPEGSGRECQGRFWHETRHPSGVALLVDGQSLPDGSVRFSDDLDDSKFSKTRQNESVGLPGHPGQFRARRRSASYYLDNRSTFDTPPERGPVRSCSPTWITLGCGCGIRRVENRCGAEDCDPCSVGKAKSYTARRRGRRLAPRVVHNLHGRALLHTTFTVPKRLRARAGNRHWWELRVKALRRQLREYWGLDWALVSYHPTGDTGGGRTFKPHLHVLWTRLEGNGFLAGDALRVLRWTWGRILGVDDMPVVNHNYVRPEDPAHDAKIWHRVQYVTRSFPGWSSWRGQASRWWGHPAAKPVVCPHCDAVMPTGERPDNEICPECGCHMGPCCEQCGEPLRFLAVLTDLDLIRFGHGPECGSPGWQQAGA